MYPRTTLSFLTTGYLKLCHFFESLKSPFLLIIRLYWGWQFFQTGLGKLSDIEHVTSFFESLGIPYPMHNAYLVGSVETIGGACLFLGFATRLVSIPLLITLLTAYATAHVASLSSILSDPKEFVTQAPFPFLYTILVVLIFGPGVVSIDALIKKYWPKHFPEDKVVL